MDPPTTEDHMDPPTHVFFFFFFGTWSSVNGLRSMGSVAGVSHEDLFKDLMAHTPAHAGLDMTVELPPLR